MSLLSRVRSWLRASTRQTRLEREMQDELEFHIDQYAADLRARGVSAEEARRLARVEFGSMDARKEECREALGLRLLGEAHADLRYTLRLLRQSPAFTIVAVLSLGLGIGANTAIFSLMETVLWKSIAVKAPEQLRLFRWVAGRDTVFGSNWGNSSTPADNVSEGSSFSYPVFQALRRHGGDTFDAVFAFKPIGRIDAVIDGQAELVVAELVSGGFYDGVGVMPALGRPILPADDRETGAEMVGVISDGFWARRFGRDPSVVGRAIQVNGVAVTIVGVNPAAFTGVELERSPDLFMPIAKQPVVLPWRYSTTPSLLDDPDYWWMLIMGRLKRGIDARQAQAALDAAMHDEIQATIGHNAGRSWPRLRLYEGARGEDLLRLSFGRSLFILFAFVGLVLLIACANLANLLLARAAARQREISLRLALGAGRARVARQMLTEGLVLALFGGAAGVAFGYWTRNAIPYLLSSSWRPEPFEAAFDTRVLAGSLAITLLTGLLFSLAPVWHATRVEVAAALKDGGRTMVGGGRPRRVARKALVAFQVSLSVLLLIGAGLFVRTVWNLRAADLGFKPERILLFTLNPPRTRYAEEHLKALYARLEQDIAALPGVESASLSSIPLLADGSSTTNVAPIEREQRKDGSDRAWVNEVGERFFETMGIPLIAGRALNADDRNGAPLAAVVNQQFLRKFFPGDPNPIGKSFHNGTRVWQIVGISGDARYSRVGEPVPPTFYRAYAQADRLAGMTFAVRTAMEPAAIVRGIRETVRAVDKDLPVFDVRTQIEQVDDTFSRQRLFAILGSAFGLLALVLASIGIYGVIASGVVSRTGEIGIRLALGAERRQVLFMILRETFGLAGAGVALGLLAAAGLARYVESLLYGLEPFDPVTAGVAVALMLAVAILAGWWPARKASRLDPMSALRAD
jgi:predicted permease